MNDRWTREQEIVVFNLYCKIPFQKSSKTHPDVIKIASIIGRSPSAVNMKIGNFGSFDETLKEKGIVGLTNASKLDKAIWDEFNGRWDELSYESERLIAKLSNSAMSISGDDNVPLGDDKKVEVKQRINQSFFRQAVLTSYLSTCCITGLCTPQLLIASHIKPWRLCDASEKTNPRNGLCLNALHDKAFDQGFITVTPEYKVVVSDEIHDIYSGSIVEQYFTKHNGSELILPEKFIPNKKYLEYHNDKVFEKWK